MALAAYRNLLRAARTAFADDARVLVAARQQIRENFRSMALLSPSDSAVEPAIQQARELAQFLRSNVVQGKKQGDRYRLRIHEHTERGDNDTVKFADGKTVKIDGKRCSDR